MFMDAVYTDGNSGMTQGAWRGKTLSKDSVKLIRRGLTVQVHTDPDMLLKQPNTIRIR